MDKSSVRKAFGQTLLNVTRMTAVGRLMDATRLIQRALSGSADAGAQSAGAARPNPQAPDPAANDPHLIIEETRLPVATQVAEFEVQAPPHHEDLAPQARPKPSSFTHHMFEFGGEQYPYRLYVPATPALPASTELQPQTGRPLIVLLHGCTQNALDFANGTAMNELAEKHQCLVLYPEQIAKTNSSRCWNWFEPGHQKRDSGEPGMIAALTRFVLSSDFDGQRADPSRVYIAGLSAGGAMAAVVSSLYPDLFAALGVHSGLPAGAARDMVSAFSAMRRGTKGKPAAAIPTIIFHGSADKTVHPDNGENISDAALVALKASGLALEKTRSKISDAREQTTERTIYRAANGPSYVEHWLVDAGPHAWSGGDASGSYTDPQGPSASAAMLTFFLQHKKL